MLITDMIAQLEALKEEPGDLPVYADIEADEVEIEAYGFPSMKYVYIRGVRQLDNE